MGETTAADQVGRAPEDVEQRVLAAARSVIPESAFPHARARYTPGETFALTIKLALPDPGRQLTNEQRMGLLQGACRPYEGRREELLKEMGRLAGGRVILVFEFPEGDVRIIHAHPSSSATVTVTARLPQAHVEILDLLVTAGLSASRTAAIDWCIRRLAEKEAELLAELKPIAEQRARLREKYGLAFTS